MTRAGKGQGIIEPTIDMWTREKETQNIVLNDPKGELLVKFYVRATIRGFQVVQFNLINSLNTDIYNPLMLAADSAREGDTTSCAMFVQNIADVFFPVEGADDPVWPNSATNVFRRTTFQMIDMLMEKEKKMRLQAVAKNIDPKILEVQLDRLWGQCTLYNAYQFFLNMSGKRLNNPEATVVGEMEADMKIEDTSKRKHSNEEWKKRLELAQKQAVVWKGEKELDLMSLYSNATELLPSNGIRTLISNANGSIKVIDNAEKMLASIYGIALTAMNFFTDPTISRLTSGMPSQTVDLAGLSFPRRFGVRFDPDYVSKQHLVGARAHFSAYSDKNFTKSLGADFKHSDTVGDIGWAKYFFKGIFEKKVSYIKLELFERNSRMLIDTFYFKFEKQNQRNATGRSYLEDPITGEKIIKDGVLYELVPEKDKKGNVKYVQKQSMMKSKEVRRTNNDWQLHESEKPVIIATSVKYAEKQKLVDLITPPHLLGYAKVVLILVKQLVDLNLGQSYLTKENQAPLYGTNYMLDEVGNLKSEGHGIQGLETILSIGLSAKQQLTLILQTLQQLRDVYGDSIDKIAQGNIANIVFLKSTDDSMLKTLETMSGITHVSRADSKTITTDMNNITELARNKGEISYNIATKEEPVIKYNDMAFIPDRNSIVFQAGQSPIWNRNEMVMPMSWRLFANTIVDPNNDDNKDHKYTLQTIPTLSTAMDFDVRRNQPDFNEWFNERLEQVVYIEQAKELYAKLHGYSERDIEILDPDVYADDIMKLVNSLIKVDYPDRPDELGAPHMKSTGRHDGTSLADQAVEDKVLKANFENMTNTKASYDAKQFINKLLAKSDFINVDEFDKDTGQPVEKATHKFDALILKWVRDNWQDVLDDDKNFTFDVERSTAYMSYHQDILGPNSQIFLKYRGSQADVNYEKETSDIKSNMYGEKGATNAYAEVDRFEVTDAFYFYLGNMSPKAMSDMANRTFHNMMLSEVDPNRVSSDKEG